MGKTCMAALSNAEDRFILETFEQMPEGDRRAARQWGERFAALFPNRYEPWLILGLLSDPPLSIYCMKRALQLNPKSGQALAGLHRTIKPLLDSAEGKSTPVPARRPAFPSPAGRVRQPNKVGAYRLLPAVFILAAGCGAFGVVWRVRAAENQMGAGATATPTPFQPVSPTPRPTQTPTAILTQEPAATATILPLPSVTPTSLAIAPSNAIQSSEGKSIVVSLSQQYLYAYDSGTLVYSFVISTGQNGGTAPGNFNILDKISDAWSEPWGFWMPDWMGIYYPTPDMEDGIHALPVLPDGETIWGNDLGTPVSYGCIVLGSEDAELLFQWTEIGTPVSIQE
jgi:lipoprotein-anchoring transpeptidase ErfK/SrfK